jgi:hypothetical protein
MTSLLLLAAMMVQSEPLGFGHETELSTKKTRAVVHAYAQCIVKRQPVKAAEAIVRNADNATLLRNYPKLMNGDCLTLGSSDVVQARFGGDLYRYALADALVNRDLATFSGNDFSAVPKLDHRAPGEPPARINAKGKKLGAKQYEAAVASHDEAKALTYLSTYGECVVRSAPAAAQALLLTTPDSPEETARFRALSPALSSCLPAGATLKFGKVTLRGTIAVNYYRLAMAARAAATGTAG